MNTVSNINEWQQIRRQISGRTIGFVPTMGNLHEGHLSLCNRSIIDNEITVVSIFVNPTQFNQTSDFDLYPRTLEEDKKLLSAIGVDYLLLPDAGSIYPDNYTLRITENQISSDLEGEFRRGHFDGMLTVVIKLLNLVGPARAYFGEKDYQQLLLIKKMVDALFIPTEIVACETMRANDGLALSSRNSRLTAQGREQAAHFPRLLKSSLTPNDIIKQLNQCNIKVDYIIEKWQRRLGAVWIGDVRLIDNIPI